MTILKALKDRIRSMGGETNATNIADAIKDLPKGGSSEPMVVTFELDGENLTADKTPEEVKEHMLTKPVIGVLHMPNEVSGEDEVIPLGCAHTTYESYTPMFMLSVIDTEEKVFTPIVSIIVENNSWVVLA